MRERYQRRGGSASGGGERGLAGGQRGNPPGARWAAARAGGAALTARFRPSAGADNGVAVPGAPSPCSAARVRPLSPKLLSI